MRARLIAVLLGASLGAVAFFAAWGLCGRLAPVFELEMRVVDACGEPVTYLNWCVMEVTPGGGARTYAADSGSTHPGGILRVQVPAREIEVSIGAPHLRTTMLGPLNPESVRTRLEARLEDLGVIQGVVLRDGNPVSGASVVLLRHSPNPWDDHESGLFYGCSEDRGETDEAGRFRIPSDADGVPLWVRAWKAGSASGMSGPVLVGSPPIQVGLGDGGALAGHLSVGPGRSLEGCAIEVYREDHDGDLYPPSLERFTAPVDHAGTFVFEHLEAGPWLVRLEPPVGEYGMEVPRTDEYVPFLVAVEEHETARLEMDLTRPPHQLVAHITMNGRPWTSCWPALYSVGAKTLMLESTEADEHGNWVLRSRDAGKFMLVIVGNHEHDISVPRRAWGEVELRPGETRFERTLEWRRLDLSEVRLDQSR